MHQAQLRHTTHHKYYSFYATQTSIVVFNILISRPPIDDHKNRPYTITRIHIDINIYVKME